MTELLFIRHAETELAGTFCGHSNPPVNDAGKLQIQKLIADLQATPIDAMVSSDLARAQQTAAVLAEYFHAPLTIDPALREIDFGAWEGLAWQQIEARDPHFARLWADTFPATTPPDGEPFASFRDRVRNALTTIATRSKRERIAIVTHAGVMRMILQEVLGVSAEDAWAQTKPYCAVFSCEAAVLHAGLRP